MPFQTDYTTAATADTCKNIQCEDKTASVGSPEPQSPGTTGQSAFFPAFPMKSGHVQTVVTGSSLRRPLVLHRAAGMLAASNSRIICCRDGIRLCGYFSGHGRPSRQLAILIHGWGGQADSSYIISAAGYLWDRGYDIFRLNLRDHGETKHLNRGLFHSCRINEVVSAVKAIQALFRREHTVLLGFSLGGNFALRVALRAPKAGIVLDRVAAVSPVLDPAHTLHVIETGWQVYHWYYLKKWKDSLVAKKKYFPDIRGLDNLKRFSSMAAMTDYFVEHFTEYPTTTDYLNGYTLTGDVLAGLSIPTLVITAKDDPIIPVADFAHIPENDVLHSEIYDHGGHCGFFTGPQVKSYAEKQIREFFTIPNL